MLLLLLLLLLLCWPPLAVVQNENEVQLLYWIVRHIGEKGELLYMVVLLTSGGTASDVVWARAETGDEGHRAHRDLIIQTRPVRVLLRARR